MSEPTAAPPWPPLLAAKRRFSQSAPHAQHGMHLVLGIDGAIRSRLAGEPSLVGSTGIITEPDVAHEINFASDEVSLVFIDPESDVGAALRTVIGGGARRISPPERDAIDRSRSPMEIMREGGVEWLRTVVSALGASLPRARAKLHPAVGKVLALARTMDESLSLGALAESVGLSEGRLMHAFTESVGIPLRPYVAWLRVQRAVAAIAGGAGAGILECCRWFSVTWREARRTRRSRDRRSAGWSFPGERAAQRDGGG